MQDAPYLLIPLRARSGIVIAQAKVSPEDHAELGRFPWHRTAKGYVARNIKLDSGKRTLYLMHRAVLGLERGDGQVIDHINRDPLDNRRENLRVVSHQRNMCNVGAHRGSTSRFRGVSWDTRDGSWTACAKLHYRKYHLGQFASEHDAARAVDAFWVGHDCEAPNGV